jgi:transketolase
MCNNLTIKIINTLRLLSVDMVDKSNSGHPGMPIGCAPMMFVLWCKIMKFNPDVPLWNNRDRFILSNGHGCALLYSMLYLLGYNYSMDDLQNFRQLHSKTPGHPEYNKNLGIEVSTGPLGQGIANGVGMAIASKKLGLDNQIYVMCGDGCLMEGISYESASLAGHLGLNNLIVLYDDNGITIDGKTDITFTENVRGRFIALNWNILEVLDGDNDVNDIYDKITMAKNSTDKPTIIFVKTIIGYGSALAGTSACHGAPLGNIKTQLLKEYFGFDKEKTFFIDEDVHDFFKLLKQDKIKYYTEQPELDVCVENDISMVVSQIRQIHNQEKNYATRESSSIVLKQVVSSLQNIIVGSADLAESNKTWVSAGFITKYDFSQKYLHYGIREHAMAAIANGISTYDIIPIVSTFFVFITYCLAPIRMAAISHHKVIYILTHDSVFLGEDGPTHQPIESLTVLRSIPHLLTIRPCDTTEVSGAYQIALLHDGPCALILSRQTLPNLENSNMDKMTKGAYVVYEPKNIQFIIVATGSEVSLAIEVAEHMGNIRVVSMPCCELFDLQDILYKEEIMPANIKKMSLEAGATLGWYKYVDYAYGIDSFGASGTMKDIKTYFGFTKSNIVNYLVKTVKYWGSI